METPYTVTHRVFAREDPTSESLDTEHEHPPADEPAPSSKGTTAGGRRGAQKQKAARDAALIATLFPETPSPSLKKKKKKKKHGASRHPTPHPVTPLTGAAPAVYRALINPKLEGQVSVIPPMSVQHVRQAIEFLQFPNNITADVPLGCLQHSMWGLPACNVKLPPKNLGAGFVPYMAPQSKQHGQMTKVRQVVLRVAGPMKSARLLILFRHDARVFMIARAWLSSHQNKSKKHGNENYIAGTRDLHVWENAGGSLW